MAVAGTDDPGPVDERSLRSDSVCDRMIRAVDDQLVIPITMTMTISVIRIPGISVVAEPTTSWMIGVRIRARTNVGITRKKSVIRISDESVNAADEPGDDAHHDADEDRDERREQPDRQRHAGAVDREVEHVPAELVRSQQVGERGRLEPAAGRGHAVWSGPDEQGRGDRQDREEHGG